MKVTAEIDLPLDVKMLAAAFANLDDESQAQFFIEVAAIAKEWKNHAGYQWFLVSKHLRTCSCSTTEARDMVLALSSELVDQ